MEGRVLLRFLLALTAVSLVAVGYRVVSNSVDRSPDTAPSATATEAVRPASSDDAADPNRSVDAPEARLPTVAQQDGLRRTIRFADGDSVSVVFKSASSADDVQLSAAVLNDYPELLALAEEGNGAAAHEVYKLMSGCAAAPGTEAELEDAIGQLYSTFSIPDPAAPDGVRRLGSDTDLGQVESRLRSSFDRCRDVGGSENREPIDYLRIAAESGRFPVTLEYARLLEKDDVAASIPYFEKAWEHGDVNAALALGEIYLRGYGAEAPDRQKAYAYTYLGAQLSMSFHEGQEGEAAVLIRDIVEQRMEQRLSEFYPAEESAGTELAKSMLNANSNCCVY